MLRQFYKLTELWSGHKYPTLSDVLPLLALAVAKLSPSENDFPAVSSMKDNLRTSLNRRFDLLAADPTTAPVIAAALDPRFKQLHLLPDTAKTAVKDHLRSLMEPILIGDNQARTKNY